VTWKLSLRAGEQRNVDFGLYVDVLASYDSGAR
jgi:hypothetical protein